MQAAGGPLDTLGGKDLQIIFKVQVNYLSKRLKTLKVYGFPHYFPIRLMKKLLYVIRKVYLTAFVDLQSKRYFTHPVTYLRC